MRDPVRCWLFADRGVFCDLATTGDSSGNLSFGFTPDDVKLFPEVEVNYWVSETHTVCLFEDRIRR